MPIVSNRISSSRKNIDKTKRNGAQEESRTVVKYITNMGKDGVSGEDAYNFYITPQTYTFAGGAAAAQSDSIVLKVHGYRGTQRLDTSIGTITYDSSRAGLSTSVAYSGTNRAEVEVSVTSALTDRAGNFTIPITYIVGETDSSTELVPEIWGEGNTFASTEVMFSWAVAQSGGDMYVLDLTNEIAMINCNADGSIYDGAVRPTCTANLYFGANRVNNATYTISTPSSAYAQGLSINASTGVMTFNSGTASTPFSFTGTSLEITVKAYIDENGVATKKGEKIMTVTKNYPGADGNSVTRWLTTSVSRIKVNPNDNTVSPSNVGAECWKQVNDQQPTTDSTTLIYYAWDTSTPNLTYYGPVSTSGAASHDYLAFGLKNSSNQFYELETIPVISDGKNGADGSTGPAGPPGAAGRQGPAIRGPYLFDPSTARRYCSGNDASIESGTQEEDEDTLWIDVMFREVNNQKVYYYCTKTYETNGNRPWSGSQGVSGNWTQATEQFDFIATKLLLAQDAAIDFITGNQLLLKDSSNNIVGGAQGPDQSTGVVFWAGGDGVMQSGHTGYGNFWVDLNGKITAKSGTFAGYVQFPYTFVADLDEDVRLYQSSVGYKWVSETDWKGSLASAPTGPSTGWCYRNTGNNNYYYYYSGSWRQMSVQSSSGIRGYVADDRAYLVSNGLNEGTQAWSMLALPAPSSALNGFTYDIIIEPSITRMDGIQELQIWARDNSTIYCYAFSERIDEKSYLLPGGRYTITCMPRYLQSSVGYCWAITQATGGLTLFDSSGNLDQYMSNVLGIAMDGQFYAVNKIVSYSGTKPSLRNDRGTIYVSRD